jgi:hypothetical protein
MVFYIVRFRDVALAVRITCADCVNRCGPRSNLNFVHLLRRTFAFYAANHAMVIVPSHASGDKLLYVHHYRPEIGGGESRGCGWCLWDSDPRECYDFGCRGPEACNCTLCLKQPPSLKSSASEILFRFLYNIDKFYLDRDTTYYQYFYAVQHVVNVANETLVPFYTFPALLDMQCIEFDDSSLGRVHEHCFSASVCGMVEVL